jgi:spermidine/putrescine transport system permease protein
MLSLSLQSCNPATGACVMTWHWAEFGQQLSLYHTQFVTSIYFAGAATLICLVVSFPIAYWIAFYGGNKKNFFLLMLLVPFFVSFVIRTIVWQFILSDQGIILGALKNIGLLPQSFHILATGWAVIAGLAYNYLPFTALPAVRGDRADRQAGARRRLRPVRDQAAGLPAGDPAAHHPGPVRGVPAHRSSRPSATT